ncbi:TrpR-related protein YerC/YecD [Enterococcus rotai]|uniref:TrpR-related protein YerC/YecD n=1 Tax=Enterococcus rotai TaxID=118060 RepID=A0A0U2XA39_9ENTE|nr:YerC/YecD family TrpR-related protein [Enterococcus rotai]ALS37719.1 TrpR-related protein YerC/YecD [Enterococcus rotai]
MKIDKIQDGHGDEFFRSLLALETLEDCYDYFDDLMTLKELDSMIQRFEVAKLLLLNKTYSDIAEATGSSTTTISRVKRIIDEGNGGLLEMVHRIDEQDDRELHR